MNAITEEMAIASAINRLWNKIHIRRTTGCWEWTGTLCSSGYGHIWMPKNHPSGKSKMLTHRLSFYLIRGPIPEKLQIDHLCRNKICCNPWHLEPVTQRENLLRGTGLSAVNAAKTNCHKGHPFSGDNLYTDAKGKRHCRECGRVNRLKLYHQKKKSNVA